MERRLAALLLAVLVVLAGCTGANDPTTPATTGDAAPTTESTTATADSTTATTDPTTIDPATADLPPGVNESGVANASRLLGAHRDALSESGFAFRLEVDTSLDGDYGSRSLVRGVVAETLAPFRIRTEAEAATGNGTLQYEMDTWSNESVALTQYRVGNRTDYRKQDASTDGSTDAHAGTALRTVNVARQATQFHVVEFALATGEYEVAAVESRNGTTVTTLRATGHNRSLADGSTGNVSRYASTLVVDERGRVHRLNTTLTTDETSTRYDYEITHLGDVSVAYPGWADRALATITARITVDSNATGGYFTVTNEAGDTLPPGTEVRVSHAGVTATLELDASLAPGEQVSISFPEGEDRPVLSDDSLAGDATEPLEGDYEFVVAGPNGDVLLNAGFGISSASASAGAGGAGGTADGGTTTTANE